MSASQALHGDTIGTIKNRLILMQDTDADQEERLSPPRSPLRVMQILTELAKGRSGLSLARLSDQLQLPKTSLFSLLRSLEEGGYVISENGHHRLGPSAFKLAAAIYQHDGLNDRLRPALQWVQEQSGETALLAVPASDWVTLVFADVIEAESSLRFTARVGAQRPLYSTSVGLALLAFAPGEVQRQYLAQTELKRLTPSTLTSASALQRVLQRVRKDGYSTSSGSVNGATAVAAPVFDLQSHLVASIGVAGPTSRLEEDLDRFIELVVEAARRMSRMLGHAGTVPPTGARTT